MGNRERWKILFNCAEKKIKDTFFSLNYEEIFFQSGAGVGAGSRAGAGAAGLNLEGPEPEPFRSR